MDLDNSKDFVKYNLADNNNLSEIINQDELMEDRVGYVGFVHKSEEEKLREDIFRSPMEKLHLFIQMLRRELVLKNARIIKP